MPLPISDISNPDVIKFLIENYEKVTRLRMKWNTIHKDKLYYAASLRRPEKGYFETDVLKTAMIAGLPTIKRDNIAGTRNLRVKPLRDAKSVPGIDSLRKDHLITKVGLGDVNEDPRLGRDDTDLSLDPKMRPMPVEQREILYKDLPFYGREVYLKDRYKMAPEDKFYLKESEGWEYGWRLKDSYFGKGSNRLGRVYRLTRDTKSRTGPQPDPNYYHSSDIPGVSKCSM